MPDDDNDRCGERRRGENGVLEHPQSEHAPPCLRCGQAGSLQGGPVEREAAAVDEDPEAGRDECRGLWHLQLCTMIDPRDLSVGDGVTRVGNELPAHGDDQPLPMGVDEPGQRLLDPDGPGESEEGARSERSCDTHEDDEPVGRPQILVAAGSHRQRRSRTSGLYAWG